MPGWLINLAIGLVITALLPRQKPQPPQAASLSDFDIPRSEEGAEIGRAYGSVWIKAPHVADYEDFKSVPIRKKGGKK